MRMAPVCRSPAEGGEAGVLKYARIWGLLAVVTAGCNGAPSPPAQPPVYPVTGKVYLGGTPVRYGRIHLEPINPGRGVNCWGNIGPDGTFVLRTFADGDGAAVGDYYVWIEPYNLAINGKVSGSPTPIPGRYQSVETSGLEVSITEDMNELPPFDLKR
jgi:hypothetical protein